VVPRFKSVLLHFGGAPGCPTCLLATPWDACAVRFVVLALGVLSLAGCSGNGGSPAPEATPEPEVLDSDGRDSRGSGAVSGQQDVLDPATGERVATYWVNGTYLAKAPGAWGTGMHLGEARKELVLSEKTNEVTLVLSWSSPGDIQDLDPVFGMPGCTQLVAGCVRHGVLWPQDREGVVGNDGGGPGMPDSPATVVVDRQTIQDNLSCNVAGFCDWFALVSTHSVVMADVTFSMKVEVRTAG
jgi:hypothetical protein